MSFEAIIFDKDGTLFDFRASWSGWAADVLDELCGDDPGLMREASAVVGFDRHERRFDKSSIIIAATSREVADALSPVLGRRSDDILTVLRNTAAASPQVPVEGVGATLRDLAPRHRLGVVTNDNEATARAHIAALGVSDVFDGIIGYDSGFGAKPDPGPLLGFCESHGVDPARSVMVGDSRHDLEAGRRAGMVTIGVLTGIAEAHDLADLADEIMADIRGLPAWIRQASPAPR